MPRSAAPIKEVAARILNRLSEKKRAKEERIKQAWQRAAGERFGGHTLPVSLRRKELLVNVDSSGFLYELTMRKREILSALRKVLKNEIRRVRFRIGQIKE